MPSKYDQLFETHRTVGYVALADKLAGREMKIFAERDRKLVKARQSRKVARGTQPSGGVDFAAIRSHVTIR